MNSKFYFAAALALSLAACTTEDDLQQNSSNQISPISFVMETGGDFSSRAAWGEGDYAYTLQWTDGDLLSLYHGGEEGGLDGLQNAIYKAKAGSSEGKLEFTTQSMIVEGQAIMVYPADTTFKYDGNGLFVTVPAKQTSASNLNQIPFISEGINIAKYDEIKNQGAGYGKEYPIKMRQVGTQITLKSNWTGDALDKINALVESEGIEEIKVDYVTMNRPTDKFNVAVPVGLKDIETGIGKNWDNVFDPAKTIDSWNMMSYADVEAQNIETSEFLTSSDADLNTCEFTLLPQNYIAATTGGTSTAAEGAEGAEKTQEEIYGGAEADASIVIMTYYGSVTLDEESEKVMYTATYTDDEENWMTVPAGLNMIVKNTQRLAGETSTFVGEVVGSHGTVWMNADLSTLDMSAVHIKSDKQLRDVLCVYNAIKNRESVKLTIDGDADGVFTLSMDNVKTLQSDGYENVKLLPCDDNGEVCETIKLIGGGEVPEIMFITENKVDVILASGYEWTWTDGARRFGNNTKTLTNEGYLTVAAGAEIGDSYRESVPMFNKGTMTINGLVMQQTALTNYGTITINKGAEYRADAAIITNEATSARVMGKVYNSGIFAVQGETNGEINNYGYIENMVGGNSNMTYITVNETENAAFNAVWSDKNKFGTIVLKNADDNISVNKATATGFIKYTYTEETYATPDVCKYNYLIVNNHDITFPETEEGYKEIKFLEVTSEGDNVPAIYQKNNYLPNLRGFILYGKANVKENNKLVVPAAYIDGTFYYGGLFCVDKQPDVLPTINGVYYGNSSDKCLVEVK